MDGYLRDSRHSWNLRDSEAPPAVADENVGPGALWLTPGDRHRVVVEQCARFQTILVNAGQL